MIAQQTPEAIQVIVLMYRRHESWARRSGFAPMEWQDFKRSRLENPLSRGVIAKAIQQPHMRAAAGEGDEA